MRTLSALLFILSSTLAWSQQPTSATTDDGRKVSLYPDGTWRLIRNTAGSSTPATTYKKSQAASLFVKAANGPFGVWMDPEKWKRDNSAEEDPGKVNLFHKRGNAYAMIISERISIPKDTLKKIVVMKAKEAAPDVKVVSQEKRVVNGKEVLCLKLTGTVQKIPFVYYGYYYGGPEGTLQVVGYTSAPLFDECKADLEELLNGTQIGQ